jgi:hypothetical protein
MTGSIQSSVAISIGFLLVLTLSKGAQTAPMVTLNIKDHLFYPAEFTVPADRKIKLLIINSDPTPEEFESYELNREKVIPGNSKAVIFIGPLRPGIYPFFGEFYPKTAQGRIVVK